MPACIVTLPDLTRLQVGPGRNAWQHPAGEAQIVIWHCKPAGYCIYQEEISYRDLAVSSRHLEDTALPW